MSAHVYAGFLGGLVSAASLQPLDLLKTRMQQQPGMGIARTLRSVHSVGEAWRGTLPSMIRTSVGAGLYLGVLSELRAFRSKKSDYRKTSESSILPRISALDNVLTGAVARSAVGLIMMPVTVIKVRFESTLFRYSSLTMAFRDIVNGPSGLRGLFAGYGATISRDAPYAGLYMLFYEQTKDMLQLEALAGPATNALAAMNAACLASTFTAPFDTLKTRIQTSKDPLSFLNAWKQVTKTGFASLFDGLSLRLARKALSAGISWCIYEEIVKAVSAGGW